MGKIKVSACVWINWKRMLIVMYDMYYAVENQKSDMSLANNFLRMHCLCFHLLAAH